MMAWEPMKDLVEKTLDEVLPRAEARPAALSEAMRYAVGTGGKRIRPLICLASAVAVGGRVEDAKYPAAAIELLHNYTLIHDDLPAMDNDRERRGKPTVWVKFGEANAILAGDALLALAYQVAAKAPRNVAAIVDVLGEKGVQSLRFRNLKRQTSNPKRTISSTATRPPICSSRRRRWAGLLAVEATPTLRRSGSLHSTSAWRFSMKTISSTATGFIRRGRPNGSSTRRRQRP